MRTPKNELSSSPLSPPSFEKKEERGVVQKVTAIIRHFKVEEVSDALKEIGIHGITWKEARGRGNQGGGHKETYRGAEYTVEFIPKVEAVIYVQRDIAQRVVELIASKAHTGQTGDGLVVVEDVADIVSIRTGKRGEQAL